MSRKNRKNHTATAGTDDNRHLHAEAEDPGQQGAQTTEDKVRAALAATPGSTTATLAMAAGVGRSTAAKILARWGRDGTAIRAAGDGPRNPDTWALATSDRDTAAPDTAAPDTEDTQPDATPSADDPTEHTADDTTKDPAVAEDAAVDVDDTTTEDTTAVQEVTAGSDADASEPDATTDTTDEAAPSSDADAETDNTAPLPDTTPVDPADRATENETEPSPAETPAVADTTDAPRADKDRLPKGGLRALVEEYLTDHPGESVGPAKIGKDLSRSGGAVNNALEKLVADGCAIKTSEAPKRFAINPDKTDVPDTAEDADAPALEA